MGMIDKQAQFLLDACKLVEKATEMGYTVTAGEMWRPVEMQQLYVKTGRSKTMASKHLDRCAIDLNFFKDGKLQSREGIKPLGDWWESLSPQHRWGGNWRGLVDQGKSSFVDAPHFELS